MTTQTTAIAPSVHAQGEDDAIDLARFTRALWAGKYWIAAATFAAMLIGVIYAVFFTTPVYTASARLILEDQPGNFAGLEGVVTTLGDDAVSMNTEFQVMQSPDLLKKVVRKYDLHQDPTFNPYLTEPPFRLKEAIRAIFVSPSPRVIPDEETQIAVTAGVVANTLRIYTLRNTRVFVISSTTINPKSSQTLVNALADEYILNQIEVKFDAIQQATEWLALRVAELESDLKASQAELQNFTAQRNIPTPEAVQGLTRQLTDIRGRIATNRDGLDAARQRADTLRAAVDAGDIDRVLAITQDPSLLRMIDLRDQGQDLENAIAGRLETLALQAQQEFVTLQDQIASLEASEKQLAERIDVQAAGVAEAEQLRQRVEASRTIYEYFLNRLKETSVQRGIQQADARVLSAAARPSGPSAPSKSRIVVMFTALGLLLSAGVLVGIEALNRGYRTSEALEQDTGVTVFGQIPRIHAGSRLDILDYLTQNPNSAAAEAYRNLRTSILLSDLDTPPQVILSTSSLPAEGKTVQAFALAMNMASMGRKVLLIEGDVRRSIFTARLGFEQGPGLIGVLAKQTSLDDAIVRDKNDSFDILIGGKARTNPVDVFSSHAFTDLMKDLRETYDMIIIDSPPLLAVPDARVMGQQVDTIIYSVRWNATTRAQVKEGLALLQTVNLKVSGLVLAQVNLKTMRSYGYGGYGTYGGKYYSTG